MKRLRTFIIVALILLSLCSCSGKKLDKNKDYTDNITVKILHGEDEHIVINENNELNYYINGKFKSKQDSKYSHDKIIETFDTEYIDEVSLDNLSTITDRVYKGNIEQFLGYIKLLKNNGFHIEIEAYTSRFIEYYLENDTGIIIRVIVTKEFMVVNDEVNDIPQIDIRDYLFE